MARVFFTPNLRRHLECPEVTVDANTLGEALNRVFELHPQLRSYIVDEHGSLRKHVVAFIDNQVISDRQRLSDPVAQNAEIYVLQALSGGT